MRTFAVWIKANPGVNALMLERNYAKSFGFGRFEEVCGFCLASHYFDGEPPERCSFCRALFREALLISGLAEVLSRVYRIGGSLPIASEPPRKQPFIVWRKAKSDRKAD